MLPRDHKLSKKELLGFLSFTLLVILIFASILNISRFRKKQPSHHLNSEPLIIPRSQKDWMYISSYQASSIHRREALVKNLIKTRFSNYSNPGTLTLRNLKVSESVRFTSLTPDPFTVHLPSRFDDSVVVRGNLNVRELITPSDIRIKTQIQDLSSPLNTLLKIHGKSFVFNGSVHPSIGWIAQEVRPLFPELVSEIRPPLLSISYEGFIPHLLESLREVRMRIGNLHHRLELKERIQKLRENNLRLARRLDNLEAK